MTGGERSTGGGRCARGPVREGCDAKRDLRVVNRIVLVRGELGHGAHEMQGALRMVP